MSRAIKSLLLTAMLLTMAAPGSCDTADDYYNRGIAKHDKGELDGAIADFTKAIELKPDHSDAYYNRGYLKKARGNLDGAIADYTKAIELNPDYASAYNNRGNAKKDKGDLEGAIADYIKAIELKPDDADAYYNRGYAEKDKGDLDAAIADYTKAIELNPDYASAYNNRGIAKKYKGDLEGAIADFTKATELNPKHVRAYRNRGTLRYDSHDFTNALVDFRKVVELESSNDYGRFRVWLVRARLGDAEAATTELQKYLASRTTVKPDDWASKVGRFLAGQLTELEFLAAAKNADKKTEAGELCEAYFYAGSKHLFAGDKSKAADYFQKSIATDKKTYTEYANAAAELKFLKAQKD